MQSHVQKGRSVVTGSSSLRASRLPTGLPARCYDVLGVAYEEGFPVISRFIAPNYFDAGQLLPYLPDKEFRYLRTVIVTAAVYRGLASRLRPKANLSA